MIKYHVVSGEADISEVAPDVKWRLVEYDDIDHVVYRGDRGSRNHILVENLDDDAVIVLSLKARIFVSVGPEHFTPVLRATIAGTMHD